jgi:hypothetical protein
MVSPIAPGRRVVLIAILTLVAALTAACGGGSSVTGPGSSSSGGGSAVVQGRVVTGQSAALGESPTVVLLRSALGVGLAEADTGTPVSGATVNLRNASNVVVATTTTDANGQFVFPGVAPGTYTVQVGAVVSPPVTVGAGDQAVVGVVTTSGTPPTVTIVAISTDVFNNDAQLGHAINIANASATCDLVGVTRLREQGLGWGEIAHRCGVSPSVIGLGRSNLTDADLGDARERTGHGQGSGGGNGKGKGKA